MAGFFDDSQHVATSTTSCLAKKQEQQMGKCYSSLVDCFVIVGILLSPKCFVFVMFCFGDTIFVLGQHQHVQPISICMLCSASAR